MSNGANGVGSRHSIFSMAELLGIDSQQLQKESEEQAAALKAGIASAIGGGSVPRDAFVGKRPSPGRDPEDQFVTATAVDPSHWRPPVKAITPATSSGGGRSGGK